MQITTDLPDDLHGMLSSLASSQRNSVSHTAVGLMRRGLEVPIRAAGVTHSVSVVSAVTGLPLTPMPRAITVEDVRALEDEV